MSSPAKDKPRLTEQEKKNNHIASEQKRRQAIREGFDRLASIVPGMEGQGRSENLVLQSTLDYMRIQIADYHQLKREAEAAGVDVSDLEIEGIDESTPNGA
jgi:heteromeric Ino2p/Ino4p transcription factor